MRVSLNGHQFEQTDAANALDAHDASRRRCSRRSPRNVGPRGGTRVVVSGANLHGGWAPARRFCARAGRGDGGRRLCAARRCRERRRRRWHRQVSLNGASSRWRPQPSPTSARRRSTHQLPGARWAAGGWSLKLRPAAHGDAVYRRNLLPVFARADAISVNATVGVTHDGLTDAIAPSPLVAAVGGRARCGLAQRPAVVAAPGTSSRRIAQARCPSRRSPRGASVGGADETIAGTALPTLALARRLKRRGRRRHVRQRTSTSATHARAALADAAGHFMSLISRVRRGGRRTGPPRCRTRCGTRGGAAASRRSCSTSPPRAAPRRRLASARPQPAACSLRGAAATARRLAGRAPPLDATSSAARRPWRKRAGRTATASPSRTAAPGGASGRVPRRARRRPTAARSKLRTLRVCAPHGGRRGWAERWRHASASCSFASASWRRGPRRRPSTARRRRHAGGMRNSVTSAARLARALRRRRLIIDAERFLSVVEAVGGARTAAGRGLLRSARGATAPRRAARAARRASEGHAVGGRASSPARASATEGDGADYDVEPSRRGRGHEGDAAALRTAAASRALSAASAAPREVAPAATTTTSIMRTLQLHPDRRRFRSTRRATYDGAEARTARPSSSAARRARQWCHWGRRRGRRVAPRLVRVCS